MTRTIPDTPSIDGLEAKWRDAWERDGIYRFRPDVVRNSVYSIDTPPPTVSGSLHIGHVFSYTHTDTVARYKRMAGHEVFYPMGWDDNGLPTERRVQNYYGVRCDPALPHDPGFVAPATPFDPPRPISRRNFVDLCLGLTAVDEQAFENLWKQLGLSIDWSMTYTTIGEESRRISQLAFLRNLGRGEAYVADAPVLWDIDFRTAVAQAELEDRERAGAYHRIAFHRRDGEAIYVETTRPELIPSCVALVHHPDDERYAEMTGTTARTPLFGVEVPVLSHELAEPDKGTGIAMICTFGDTTDVTWWRELELPSRAVIQRNGRFVEDTPAWIPDGTAFGELAGKTVNQARRRIVDMLTESGDLDGEPRVITHAVKFYEKGERPLEIVSSRQWYIRNGGRDEQLRAQLLERGLELEWIPEFMRVRYEHWVEGLAGDWLISRQRYFGVPIPLWYPLDQQGEPDYAAPIPADEAALPVDPASEPAPGYRNEQRGQPGGFVADPDVMDTWATSSLSPLIVTGWERDADLFARTYPMDLRPQSHDIIRTWLFATLTRAHLELDGLPWSHVAISGWIMDPDRKKMSKSKGNAVTPMDLLDEYGSDGVRYWAASGRPGTDTLFDPAQMKVGRRLAIKLLNASRFVLGFGESAGEITEPLDLSMLASLRRVVTEATAAFEAYDYARALERTEASFWSWTDDYLELVKVRAYGESPGANSARSALELSLSVYLRLFAPVLPFVTEEVWSWWRDGSIHRSAWPTVEELPGIGDPGVLEAVAEVLGEVRRAKSEAKRSMRSEVTAVSIAGSAERLAAVRAGAEDLTAAANAGSLEFVDAAPAIVVELASE